MGFTLSERSEKALRGVHKDLQSVVRKAAELASREFIVTEGLRTLERQKELVKKGASKTLKSRHLTGHAVDLVASQGKIVSYAMSEMKSLSVFMKQAAKELGIAMDWGGDWKSFVDTPHYELNRRKYPA